MTFIFWRPPGGRINDTKASSKKDRGCHKNLQFCNIYPISESIGTIYLKNLLFCDNPGLFLSFRSSAKNYSTVSGKGRQQKLAQNTNCQNLTDSNGNHGKPYHIL